MAKVLKRGRIHRPYHDLLEQHKADQIIINNLKAERDIMQTCMDAQAREINFIRRSLNADEALIRKYYKAGAFDV